MLTAQEEGKIEELVSKYLAVFKAAVTPPFTATRDELDSTWKQLQDYTIIKSDRMKYMRELLDM